MSHLLCNMSWQMWYGPSHTPSALIMRLDHGNMLAPGVWTIFEAAGLLRKMLVQMRLMCVPCAVKTTSMFSES